MHCPFGVQSFGDILLPRALPWANMHCSFGAKTSHAIRKNTKMKPQYHQHSCPECGQRVGWVRLHLHWRLMRWRCKFCGTLLEFDSTNFTLRIFVFVAWFIFWQQFVFPYVAHWVGMVVIVLGALAFSPLDRISVAKTSSNSNEKASD